MKNLLVAMALGMMALPAQALELNRVVSLGATKLSRTGSTSTFRAPPCRQDERVEAIRIVVYNQPAQIQQLGLQFRNGNTQYFRVNQQFPGNSRTRWVDVRGNGKCITAIQISGQSMNILQKATVEVQGRVRNIGGGWPGGGNGGGWPGDDNGDYEDEYEDDYNDRNDRF